MYLRKLKRKIGNTVSSNGYHVIQNTFHYTLISPNYIFLFCRKVLFLAISKRTGAVPLSQHTILAPLQPCLPPFPKTCSNDFWGLGKVRNGVYTLFNYKIFGPTDLNTHPSRFYFRSTSFSLQKHVHTHTFILLLGKSGENVIAVYRQTNSSVHN